MYPAAHPDVEHAHTRPASFEQGLGLEGPREGMPPNDPPKLSAPQRQKGNEWMGFELPGDIMVEEVDS
jgi:hypothetical protein